MIIQVVMFGVWGRATSGQSKLDQLATNDTKQGFRGSLQKVPVIVAILSLVVADGAAAVS